MRLLLALYEHDRDVRGDMGGFRHAVELAEAWTAAGHEVAIVRPRLGVAEEPTRSRVVETPIVDRPGLRPLTAYGGLLQGGLREARRLRPDVVYARDMLGPVPLLLARATGAALVVEVNGDTYAHRRDVRRRSRAHLALVHALQRLTLRRADHVVTVTAGLRDALVARLGLGPGRVTVVGNGANVRRLVPEDAGASRQALGLDPNAPVVGFVGTFFPYQGVTTLLAAAPAIRRACPGVRFLIVGDGPARDGWLASARARGVIDACVFPGQVPHAAVGRWINAMDVAVAPFTAGRGETSPLKVFDYLACARPVVVSAIPAVVDDARASGGCVEVPPDDPRALAGTVLELLHDPERRRRLGEAGRAWVVRERSWEAVAARVLALCAGAVRAKR
ncbi:MAG TPA: glycosyltransferase family 4 protein [Terriglobales bacterium]|nr:glycosyltransferase family 4 protein [Terriglobales bacterium]